MSNVYMARTVRAIIPFNPLPHNPKKTNNSFCENIVVEGENATDLYIYVKKGQSVFFFNPFPNTLF